MNNFYNSKKWLRIRAAVLRRDGYICQISKRYGQIIEANTVHHIFPRDEFPEYELESWNLISISAERHNELHDRNTNQLTEKGIELLKRTAKKNNIKIPIELEVSKKMRVLVVGLAGTGKSTYVKKRLTEDSIAYDLDAIASAFRLRQPHEEYHAASRKMANDFLYGFLENAESYANNLYIIRTAPRINEIKDINPNELVWCKNRYVVRKSGDELSALQRIEDAVEW